MTTSMLRPVGVLGCVVLSFLVPGTNRSSAQDYRLDPYQHTYHPEHGYVPYGGGYGGYGGFSGGVTPGMGAGIGAGAAMAGYGQAAAGVGQMHVSNAQAQDIHQQAYSEYLKNIGLYQQTALDTSAKRQQATDQRNEATKAHERAQIALYNKSLQQMSAAHRLTAEQFDLDRGVLHWPFVLRTPQYADLRQKLDELYDARTPEDSGTNSSGFDGIQQACKQMQEIVNEEVKNGEMNATDFVTANHFISSIQYESRFKVKAAPSAGYASKPRSTAAVSD